MIPLFKVHMPQHIGGAVERTLLSGHIAQGPRVAEFEAGLSKLIGNPHVTVLNSGTSAIHLALRLAGVGSGSEVITTPMTCTATNMPILERGARIVWADIQPETGNIDPEDVRRKIRPQTKAIVCVHWGGYPCDLDELNSIADHYGISLIEDAAHAFLSEYKGRRIGSHSSRFVCFSFQAIKHLTTGDGGALVCRDAVDYDRAQLLCWYGIDRKAKTEDFRCDVDIPEYGYKFHMNDIAATIGLEQLPQVESLIDIHRYNANRYRAAIEGEKLDRMRLLTYKEDRLSSYWLFTILTPDRDDLMKWMKKQEVVVSQVHLRNDLHTAFKDFRCDLPALDKFASRQVSIPVGWWVSHIARTQIVQALTRWSMMG